MPPTAAEFMPEDAVVALLVTISVSDAKVRTAELLAIGRIVDHLPFFGAYDDARIKEVSNIVFDLLAEEDGLDTLWSMVKAALPERFYETAYAMACDVVASDGIARDNELRMLEEMRYELEIDRLSAAAIERAARVRHMTP